MKKSVLLLTAVAAVTLFITSCSKSKTTAPTYTVPTTYNFTNVNNNNQIMLLDMADQIVAYINTANTSPNTAISATVLTNMLNNTGAPFNDSAVNLNGSGLNLASFCTAAMKTDLLNYFDSVALYSQSTSAGSAGVAGVSPSYVTPSKKYLLSSNGIFYSQIVKKAIMGLCAYQIMNVYLVDSVSNTIDNTTITAGTGTMMEHGWDQAFGWFGVSDSFPTVTKGAKYLGSYCNQVTAGMNSNANIMNAYLKGRAAIANNDLVTKQAQANLLISTMDTFMAACIVQEMHETNTNIENNDAVAAYGTLSESLGFVRNLRYNTGKRVITDAQIAQLLNMYDNANPNNPNLYNFIGASPSLTSAQVTAQVEAKTNAIAQFIGQIYGFSAANLALL